jgi:hypothetical protein
MIDCNCEETSVPGGGPAESGANAARWDEDIQRAFYNGWKSIHGIKHQTVENASCLRIDDRLDDLVGTGQLCLTICLRRILKAFFAVPIVFMYILFTHVVKIVVKFKMHLIIIVKTIIVVVSRTCEEISMM